MMAADKQNSTVSKDDASAAATAAQDLKAASKTGGVPDKSTPPEQHCEETNGNATEGDHLSDSITEMKHPLQNKWTLWFFKNDRQKDWSLNQNAVTSFSTVEDFWALFNHIQPASRLPVGCDYSLFKDKIEPKWEDLNNVQGGRWLITLDKNKRSMNLDNYWIETLLLLIGEGFDDDSDDVCGAIVQVRAKQDKLSVWTRQANNRDTCVNIGRKLKETLQIPENIQIAYQTHTDQESKSSSFAKSTYVI